MRKIAQKLFFNWLPSAAATFIGGLALHLYLQPPVTPAASPTTEMVPITWAPISVALPNEAAPATVSDSGRSNAPAASKATRVRPEGRPALQRFPALAARKRPHNAAIADQPTPENAKAPAGSRLTAQEPIIGPPVPRVAIVEEPSLSEVPQPFSISEFKQRLRGRMAADAAWSEWLGDDPFCPFAPKLCAMKTLKALSMRIGP